MWDTKQSKKMEEKLNNTFFSLIEMTLIAWNKSKICDLIQFKYIYDILFKSNYNC